MAVTAVSGGYGHGFERKGVAGFFELEDSVEAVSTDSVNGAVAAKSAGDPVSVISPKDSAAVPADTFVRRYVASADTAAMRRGMIMVRDSVTGDTVWVDSVLPIDRTTIEYAKPDTSRRDTTPRSKSALDQPVQYSAKDSIVFHMASKRASFYGDGHVTYTNLTLDAGKITMSMDSSIVRAMGTKDSLGTVKGKPKFSQGGDKYEPDSMSYNFKSGKAFVSNTYTEQGEGFLIGESAKRDSSGVMYIGRGKYTTCDEANPHFYIALTRGKITPGKNVVFGPAYVVLEDIPLPLAIPYGFFPFSKSYHSGIVFPTFGDESDRGFYLREGGYYFAINDKLDAKLLGEIYTKGSWGLSADINYKKRYKFSGSIRVAYQNTVTGEKNMPDYSKSTSFRIQWSHRQDPKANPSFSFSASVNFATSNFERNSLNSKYNPQAYTQSTRTSSVSINKTWASIGLSMALSANLSQNVRDSSISITLPTLSLSLQPTYPFKRKKLTGQERWYEKISFRYTGNLSWSIATKEDKLLKSNLIKDWRNGMQHQIPVSATFALFKYINVTPSFSFTDRMYTNKINRSWDTERQVERRDTTYGFYNVFNYSLSVNMNTKIYGMYKPLFWKKIIAVRHVLTPSVSFSYAPDFSASRYGFWDTYVKTDRDGTVSTVSYSPFSHGMYGTAPNSMQGMLNFDLSNNLEMKIRSQKDSTGEKKISLIDEFGISMGYNFAAKEKPWSDLSMRIRLKLTKSYTFSMNASFATYAYEFDKNGKVYVGNRTEYSHGRFGRFQGASQNFSYTFNNQTFKKLFGKKDNADKAADKKKEGDDGEIDTDTNLDPETKKQNSRKEKREKAEVDADGYMKFSMPWSLTVSYGITMRENTAAEINRETMRYPYKFTHSLNFSGNISISDGWNISFSSGYDFNYHKLSMTTASLSRDLHCFTMSASIVLSPYTSYNFTFQAKASALADALKWKKSDASGGNINWY